MADYLDDEFDDDELLDETSPYVVEMLGFDPRELVEEPLTKDSLLKLSDPSINNENRRKTMTLTEQLDLVLGKKSLTDEIALVLADSCGAGTPGGKGFDKGNTCQRGAGGKSSGGEPKPKKTGKPKAKGKKGGKYTEDEDLDGLAALEQEYMDEYEMDEEAAVAEAYHTWQQLDDDEKGYYINGPGSSVVIPTEIEGPGTNKEQADFDDLVNEYRDQGMERVEAENAAYDQWAKEGAATISDVEDTLLNDPDLDPMTKGAISTEQAAEQADFERISKQQEAGEAEEQADFERISKQQEAGEAAEQADFERISKQQEAGEAEEQADFERISKQQEAAERASTFDPESGRVSNVMSDEDYSSAEDAYFAENKDALIADVDKRFQEYPEFQEMKRNDPQGYQERIESRAQDEAFDTFKHVMSEEEQLEYRGKTTDKGRVRPPSGQHGAPVGPGQRRTPVGPGPSTGSPLVEEAKKKRKRKR